MQPEGKCVTALSLVVLQIDCVKTESTILYSVDLSP